MGKDDFICKNCKSVKDAGLFGGKTKHKCPECGWLCDSCVSNGIFSDTCNKCDSKVLTYSWNGDKDKWVKS